MTQEEMKSWAFRSEFGQDKVTAYELATRKMRENPTRQRVFFCGPIGRRKRVKHVLRQSGTTFFSYIEPGDRAGNHGGAAGGESLTHRLFKEAIAQLGRTQLRLMNHGDHDVQILEGELETRYPTEKEYYADAFVKFSSDGPLAMKWSSALYIEVEKTHPVPDDKKKYLQGARVPVVEVFVPKRFIYKYDVLSTTDLRELEHRAMIKKTLENGYLMGKVISDPSSIEFLETQLLASSEALRLAQAEAQGMATAASARESALTEQVHSLRQHNSELAMRIAALEADRVEHLRQLAGAHAEEKRFKQMLVSAENKITFRDKWLLALALVLFGLIVLGVAKVPWH